MSNTPEPEVRWHQVEPRRRHRAHINGKAYDLIYRGCGAVGLDLDPGWYLEGGVSGRGHEFMARRLQEAVENATRTIRSA